VNVNYDDSSPVYDIQSLHALHVKMHVCVCVHVCMVSLVILNH
jgi:hypothetical protein